MAKLDVSVSDCVAKTSQYVKSDKPVWNEYLAFQVDDLMIQREAGRSKESLNHLDAIGNKVPDLQS